MANYGNVRLTVDGRPDLKKKAVTIEVGGKPIDDVLDGFRKSVKKIDNKQDKTTVVNIASADAAQLTIQENTIYNCGEMASIEIATPSTPNTAFITQLNFSSGKLPTEVTYPDALHWNGDSVEDGAFVPEADTRYVIIIMHDGVYWRANAQGVSIEEEGGE